MPRRKRYVVSDADIESLRGTIVFLEVKTRFPEIKVPIPKPYYGKISRYDSESITLNPYFESRDFMAVMTSSVEEFQSKLENFPSGLEGNMKETSNALELLTRWTMGRPAGSTSREITFKRKKITNMHDFFWAGNPLNSQILQQ